MTVWVEAAARLHFGVLDLRGASGRRFGGVGVAAPAPTLLVSAQRAATLEVEGEDAARAQQFARRFFESIPDLDGGARIQVHRALAVHAGLGSGTQLALSVARAIAELYEMHTEASVLARAVGRGRRSAVGTWVFADGGLVVEAGHARDAAPGGGIAPLVARLPIPPDWRCIVAVPDRPPAISGEEEDAALRALPDPTDHDVARVAHLVHEVLVRATAAGDLRAFGRALTEIQRINGEWFAPAQGGTFAAGPSEHLVRVMTKWGAHGVGQSSWGPAVYGIVEGVDASVALAAHVAAELGSQGTVYEGSFRDSGARVWRTTDDETGEVHR